jgi:hypothetical protein
MASQNIGTIFVELDLDPSRYIKGQQQLYKDATSTSLNIEQNFKNLNIKSSAEMDLMRQKVTNSFDMIANSSKATANDIIRAEEAKHAKLTALNEAQFGSQKTFIDSMKSSWVSASIAIVAAWAAVNEAVAYMDQAGKALQVESSFKLMAESSGVAAEGMIENMKKATKGTVEESDLMQKAIKLMLLGYDSTQIERFSNVVITASQFAGTTATEAYERLADAIGNRQPKAMVKMGAVTKEQMEIVTAAIKAGAKETELFELAMLNLEYKQIKLKGTQDQATISLQKFHASVKETQEAIGKGLIIAVDAAYRGFEYLAGGVLGVVSAYASYRALVYSAIGDEVKAAENREIANAAWAARNELIKKAGEAIFLESDAGKKATAQELADSKARVDTKMVELQAIADKAKATEESTKAAERLKEQWEDTKNTLESKIDQSGLDELTKKIVQNEGEAEKLKKKFESIPGAFKLIDEAQLASDADAIKAAQDKYEKEALALEKSITDAATKAAKEKATVSRKLYGDMKGYHIEYYDESIKLIDEQAAYYKSIKISEKNSAEENAKALVAIDKWVAEKKADELIKSLGDSNDFFDGISAGYKKMEKEATTWGKVGEKTFKAMTDAMSNEFSTFFEDAYKGKLKGAEEYAGAVWDGVRKSFFKLIGDMAAEKVTVLFKTAWESGGASVLSALGKLLGVDFGGSDASGDTSGYDSYYDTAGNYNSGLYFTDTTSSLSNWQGGKIGYAGGGGIKGYVGGSAPVMGDHPSNDIVNAWLSPGEVVMCRSAVNSDTAELLDYINRYGRVPWNKYYAGGMVANTVTNQSGRGYSFWESVASVASGGLSDVLEGNTPGADAQSDPVLASVLDVLSLGTSNLFAAYDAYQTDTDWKEKWAKALDRTIDMGGNIDYVLRLIGEQALPDWLRGIAPTAGVIIGGAVGTAYGGPGLGTAAGSSVGSLIGSKLQGADYESGAFRSAVSGATSYVSYAASDYVGAVMDAEQIADVAAAAGITISEASAMTISEITAKVAAKIAATAFGQSVNRMYMSVYGKEGAMDTATLMAAVIGADGVSSLLGNFLSSVPSESTYTSAASGLDYVPRDNYKTNLHKGEAVLTAEEASEYRSGGGDLSPVQINWQVDGSTLASIIYKQTKSGVKVVHERGITGV